MIGERRAHSLDRRLDIDALLVPRLVRLIFGNRRFRQSNLLVEAVDLSFVQRDLLVVKILLDLRILLEIRMVARREDQRLAGDLGLIARDLSYQAVDLGLQLIDCGGGERGVESCENLSLCDSVAFLDVDRSDD